ncbi:hypothetical protein HUJ04_001433 [Dendroctonus ponderosae]|uniref:DNA-(apurinic or apyrimidinic site) endonuclease n=1 Tax=Dendroctonus ponderosae TaxID=77166 RepID=A0AAR5QD11_DENPD|nr:hypothetical protein HUJ04_001433 [Dendroctonus ponderosae]
MIHPKFSIRALLNIIRTLDYQMSTFGQPVEAAITSKLQSSLAPSYLKIINESYMHNVSKGAETHFKVIVVTEKFNNLSLIKVISACRSEFKMPPKKALTKKVAEEDEASPAKQRRVLRPRKKNPEEKPIVNEPTVKQKAPKQPKYTVKNPEEAKSDKKTNSKIKSKSRTEENSIEGVPKRKEKEKTATEIQSSLSNPPETKGKNINVSCSKKSAKGKSFNLKITSWNVSGLRAWLKKDGLTSMLHEQPDVFCIQETKCSESKLPKEIQKVNGYHSYWCSSKKEGYAGVGVLSKIEPLNVMYGIKDQAHDEEGRCITLEFDTFYVINVYVPNAGRGLKTISKRLEWNSLFKRYVKALDDTKPVILCGDMNVAHTEIDLTNPKTNKNNAGFTQQERDGMSDFLQDGYVDSFRFLYPDVTNVYTFWSYMGNARAKNIGWRLDYFIISESLKEKVCDSTVASEVYGSDHCPINLFISI